MKIERIEMSKVQLMFLLLTFCSFILCSCTCKHSNSEFRVGIRTIPDIFDPRNNEVNVFHYINSHLYYPLFNLDPFGKIESTFLDMSLTKPIDSSFKKYDLCLKDGVTFTDNTKITASNLKQAIISAHLKNLELPSISEIHIQLNCVSLILTQSEPRYFNKLTSIDSTILKEEFNEKIKSPIGKGPFKISKRTEDELILDRTNYTNNVNVISRIAFIKINTPEEGIIKGIHDWNHLWQHLGNNAPIPSEIKSDWRKFEQSLLRSLMMIVHINNLDLRQKFTYCFNTQKYVHQVGMNVTEIPGLLPTGLSGSKVSFNEIKKSWSLSSSDCKLPKFNIKEIPFYLHYPTLEKQVSSFLKETQPYLPIKLKLKIISHKDTIKEIFSTNELVIVSLNDTMKLSPTGFFSPFVGSVTAIQKVQGLEKVIREAAQSNDPEISNMLYEKAHKMLLETGAIIPLGQIRATYYYPPFVKSIPFVDPANGFPQLDKVEVY